jgi:RNA recognition motif-containing protein
MNIYIGNFSPEITGEDLQEAFGAFGHVAFSQVSRDWMTGGSRGFGFVEMPNETEAQNAIQGIVQIKGERVTVNQANRILKDKN